MHGLGSRRSFQCCQQRVVRGFVSLLFAAEGLQPCHVLCPFGPQVRSTSMQARIHNTAATRCHVRYFADPITHSITPGPHVCIATHLSGKQWLLLTPHSPGKRRTSGRSTRRRCQQLILSHNVGRIRYTRQLRDHGESTSGQVSQEVPS